MPFLSNLLCHAAHEALAVTAELPNLDVIGCNLADLVIASSTAAIPRGKSQIALFQSNSAGQPLARASGSIASIFARMASGMSGWR
jgi:hypothetical protein